MPKKGDCLELLEDAADGRFRATAQVFQAKYFVPVARGDPAATGCFFLVPDACSRMLNVLVADLCAVRLQLSHVQGDESGRVWCASVAPEITMVLPAAETARTPIM
jgi:hypothetical protein